MKVVLFHVRLPGNKHIFFLPVLGPAKESEFVDEEIEIFAFVSPVVCEKLWIKTLLPKYLSPYCGFTCFVVEFKDSPVRLKLSVNPCVKTDGIFLHFFVMKGTFAVGVTEFFVTAPLEFLVAGKTVFLDRGHNYYFIRIIYE